MPQREWRKFDDAREFVRRLGLLDHAEWHAYSRGDLETVLGAKPADIPTTPNLVYRGAGWVSWRDWRGEAPLSPVEPGYLAFNRARRFARSLRLRSAAEWQEWARGGIAGKPRRGANVPPDPAKVYPRAWRGWGDWLGTERRAPRTPHRYLAFDRARAWARSLGLQSAREWTDLCSGRLPGRDLLQGVPASPGLIYRHSGWNGFGDWLGTGRTAFAEKPFLPFDEARELVRRMHFRDVQDYFAWSAGRRSDLPPRPMTIPGSPDDTYRGCGWTTWADFLGTDNLHPTNRDFPSFERVREFARTLGLATSDEWQSFVRESGAELRSLGADLPIQPHTLFRDAGWHGWADFLGTGKPDPRGRVLVGFEEARAFARAHGIRSSTEWGRFAKGELPDRAPMPPEIPRAPQVVFRGKGWRGWGDFLATGNRGPNDRTWRPFDEARRFARALGLRSCDEWRAMGRGEIDGRERLPPDLPRRPERFYAGRGWRGWCDFLGVARKGRRRTVWRPFPEARVFARSMAFGSSRAWEEWSRGDRPDLAPRPADIPGVPYVAYANEGWRGWRDFLGTEDRRDVPK